MIVATAAVAAVATVDAVVVAVDRAGPVDLVAQAAVGAGAGPVVPAGVAAAAVAEEGPADALA
jgi:hypothetical protein